MKNMSQSCPTDRQGVCDINVPTQYSTLLPSYPATPVLALSDLPLCRKIQEAELAQDVNCRGDSVINLQFRNQVVNKLDYRES